MLTMLNKYWVIAQYVFSGTVARSWPTQPWCQRVTSQSSLWGQMPGTMAGGSSWPLIPYRTARVASQTISWIFQFPFGKNCLKFLDDLASVNWYVFIWTDFLPYLILIIYTKYILINLFQMPPQLNFLYFKQW